MIISRVESRLDENKFIKFASNLYKGDEYWIRPLDKDVSNVFKPETNKAFKKGEVSIKIAMRSPLLQPIK